MKILVVEDDPLVRTMAVAALEDEGFEVIEAEDGEQALRHCRERIADVIFTDIQLPGTINGWDIAEHCRDQDPNVRVIYATGLSHVDPRPVPGSLWCQKPYRPHQIVAAVRALASGAP
jgi:DNA-binding response OmpR family regulator